MDAERLLGNLLGGTLSRTLGGRGSSIFRKGSLTTKANLGIGLLGLAMAAFEHYQKQSAGATPAATGATPPAPPRSSPPPPPMASPLQPPPPPAMALPATRQADAIVLIRAMIAAAQSDGRIDDDERARIAQSTAGLSSEERAFLEAEIATPSSIEAIAGASRPEIATDVYAAAAHAIVTDSDTERAWLGRLGDALQLDSSTRQRIDNEMTSR
ncbi:MAG: DUF533 domain-containing protein [Rhodanobacteraceae bacterium]